MMPFVPLLVLPNYHDICTTAGVVKLTWWHVLYCWCCKTIMMTFVQQLVLPNIIMTFVPFLVLPNNRRKQRVQEMRIKQFFHDQLWDSLQANMISSPVLDKYLLHNQRLEFGSNEWETGSLLTLRILLINLIWITHYCSSCMNIK